MSVPTRVEVEWIDSQGMSAWNDVDAHIREASESWDLTHRTTGYLLDETADYLLIAASWRPATKQVPQAAADVMVIPTFAVLKRRVLK